jgi:hypothetical protein
VDHHTAGVVLTGLIASGLRFAGAATRTSSPAFAVRIWGWGVCALAAWFAAAAAGAWAPFWIVPALGLGGAAAQRVDDGVAVRVGADVLFALAAILVSRSAVGVGAAISVLGAYALLGLVVDAAMARMQKGRGCTAAITTIALFAVISPGRGQLLPGLLGEDLASPMYLGVAVGSPGERVDLEQGAVAWVLRPPSNVRGGALVLHGNDPSGAHGTAVYSIQRALVQSGFVVVSLDHPGYGSSPNPARGGPLASWDPAPAVRGAFDLMQREAPASTPRLVIGHSMGTSDVLRILDSDAPASLAVLMSGAGTNPDGHHAYWHRRFLSKRRIDWTLSKEDWWELDQRYYDNGVLVRRLGRDHAPVLFVQCGVEWPDVQALRQGLWDAFPGDKRLVELDSMTHYLNTFELQPRVLRRWFGGRLILADVRVVPRIQRLIEDAIRKAGTDQHEGRADGTRVVR